MKIVYTTAALALVALLGASSMITNTSAQDVGDGFTFNGAADLGKDFVAGVVAPDAGAKVDIEEVSVVAEAEDLGPEPAEDDDDDEVGADADMDFGTEHIFGNALARQNIISTVNKRRLEVGLPELCMNYRLLNTAQSQAYYMAKTNLITVTSEDGFSPSQRGRSARFNSTGVAEVIGAGYTKADDLISSWLESPSSKVILLGNYTHIGPGYAVNATAPYVYYWVVDFAHGFGEPCSNLSAYSEN